MKPTYHKIAHIHDEGILFNLLSEYIAYFYKKIMKGRTRKDGPDSRIKYSRDWEYPWVLLQANVQPQQKVLDCGAGYSPLMFLWAKGGAEVHAVDRETMICAKPMYAIWCIKCILKGIFILPFFARKKMREKEEQSAKEHKTDDRQKTSQKENVFQVLRPYVENVGIQLGRILKSDFWGPIHPKMINAYGITYHHGPRADFTDLPYASNSFDVVVCVSVLEHVPQDLQLKGIREMARVLKKGGRLVITYDFIVDRTVPFIKAAGLRLTKLVHFASPKNLYKKNHPSIIGMCFVKNY